jgi:DNA-binding NarL/FixJ family response regulator
MEPNTHLKILIGYHNHLCADGLRSILHNQNDNAFIEITKNGQNLFKTLSTNKYDLLIIDLIYPGCDTLAYLTDLRKSNKSMKILLISDLIKNGMIVDIINTGVDGYILHTCSGDDLKIAVDKLLNEEQYICTSITSHVLNTKFESQKRNQDIQITSREKEVLSYLVKMHSNKKIAEKLSISEFTVKTHRKNIMKKFGSTNLISLVRYACRENLINGKDDEFCMGCPHRIRLNYN